MLHSICCRGTACVCIAVINIRLMKSNARQSELRTYAAQAEEAIQFFLHRWPRSPYAKAAIIQLQEIQNQLADPR